MDAATGAFYERQSDESKAREEEALRGGAVVATGRQIAAVMHMDADDEQARRVGLVTHQSVALMYGALAALLVGAGFRPFRVGVLTGFAALVLVDEALNAVRLEPSPFAFPAEAHLRGVVGHVTFGVALGVMLTAARPLLRR
jgi:hypothetical protein